MNRISTYIPVASKKLHAVLEMVANVEEIELAKKSAAMKIVAEKERSDNILQRYATSNAMRKRKRSKALENLLPEITAINIIMLDVVKTERECQPRCPKRLPTR